MSEDLHDDIDDIFRKGLSGHSDIPDENIWQNIDQSLDKNRVISISRKYTKLKWVAAAVLLFSVGMAMYAIHSNLKRKEAIVELDSMRRHLDRSLDSQRALPSHATPSMSTPSRQSDRVDSFSQNTEVSQMGTKTQGRPDTYSLHPTMPPAPGAQDIQALRNSRKSIPSNLLSQPLQQMPYSADNAARVNTPNRKMATPGKLNPKGNPLAVHGHDIATAHSLPSGQAKSLASPPRKLNQGQKKRTSQELALNSEIPTTHGNPEPSELPAIDQSVPRSAQNSDGIKPINGNELSRLVPATPDLTGAVSFIHTPAPRPVSEWTTSEKSSSEIHNPRNPGISKGNSSGLSKWSLTAFYSPDFVATSLAKETTGAHDEDLNEIRKEEQNGHSFSTGLLVGLRIGPRLSLQSGVKVLSWQTNIQPKRIYAHEGTNGDWHYRFDCAAGYSDLSVKSLPQPRSGDSIETYHSQNSVEYIGVPLMVAYKLGSRKLNFTPAVGFTGNFLAKGQLLTTLAPSSGIQKTTTGVLQGLRSMYLNGLVSCTANYKITRNLSVAFVPRAEFAITSINKNAPVRTHLYTFGLGGGLIYHF